MAKVNLTTLGSMGNETTFVQALNQNFTAIATAIENTLSRNGLAPNTLSASLDANSNRIINLAAPVAGADAVRKQDLDAKDVLFQGYVDEAEAARDQADAFADAASASAASAAGSVGAIAGYATDAQNAASAASVSAGQAATSSTNAANSAAAAAASAAEAADIIAGGGGGGGGTGDVVGPGSSVAGNVAQFSGTSGKIISDSGIASSALLVDSDIGSAVQAFSSHLGVLDSLSKTSGNFVVADGSTWAVQSPTTVRTTLGLVIGTNVQAFNANLAALAGTGTANSIVARNAGTDGTPSYVNSAALTSATPANGDVVVGFTAAGALRKFPVDSMIASSGGGGAIDGVYFTTMDPGNSGVANSNALMADVAAAAGGVVVVPAGEYELDETQSFTGTGARVAVSFASPLTKVRIKFLPGATVKPSAGFTGARRYLFYASGAGDDNASHFPPTDSTWADVPNIGPDIDIEGLVINGMNQISRAFTIFGCENVKFTDTYMYNVGSQVSDAGGTYGIAAFLCRTVTINEWYGEDFKAVKNQVYADQPGLNRHLYIERCEDVLLNNVRCYGPYEGEDVDPIHMQDHRTVPSMKVMAFGTFIEYDGTCRRAIKVQGGDYQFDGLVVKKASNFAASAPNNGASRVTAVTKGATTTIAAGTHGLVNGDVVTFTQMPTGFTAMNNTEFDVSNVSGANFDINFDSSGIAQTYSATAGTTAGRAAKVLRVASITTGNPTTIVTTTPHLIGATSSAATRWVPGQRVTISGVNGTTEVNGSWEVTVVNSTTFTIPVNSTNAYAADGSGRVNQETGAGRENHNGIDWAGNNPGRLKICNAKLDLTGFPVGISTGLTTPGTLTLDNCDILLSNLWVTKQSAENFQYVHTNTTGVLFITGSDECIIRNCIIRSGNRQVVAQGNRMIVENNVFDDPTSLFFYLGGSTAKVYAKVKGNTCYTRTPGFLNNEGSSTTWYAARIDATTLSRIQDNDMVQVGNTTHGNFFIRTNNAGSGGFAQGNTAPSGVTVFSCGNEHDFPNSNVNGKLLAPIITATQTSNTANTVETTLATHTIPARTMNRAGHTIRSTFVGSYANNATTKTLRVKLGSGTTVLTKSLTASQAGTWKVTLITYAVGQDSQKYTVLFEEFGTVSNSDCIHGTATNVTSGTMPILVTGQAGSGGALNDITHEFGITEDLNGQALVVN